MSKGAVYRCPGAISAGPLDIGIDQTLGRLQREMDALAELLIARIEEHLSARGWAVNLHSMRFLMNGMKFGLLLEDLDARASGPSLGADTLAEL